MDAVKEDMRKAGVPDIPVKASVKIEKEEGTQTN